MNPNDDLGYFQGTALEFVVVVAFAALSYRAGTFCIEASDRNLAEKQRIAAWILGILGGICRLFSVIMWVFFGALVVATRQLGLGYSFHALLSIGTLGVIIGIALLKVSWRKRHEESSLRARSTFEGGIAFCIVGVICWLRLLGAFG
jgi:hypothetical protein